MKKKTSLINVTKEEMKQTKAGTTPPEEPVTIGGEFRPPVGTSQGCTAYCECTCNWEVVNYLYSYTGNLNMNMVKNVG